MNGTEVFQSHSFERLSIHLYIYQFNKCLYSVCLHKEVKSLLITQLPDNHSMLISEQVFLFDYPDNCNNWATSKYSDVPVQLFNCRETLNLKKKWNKQQLEMAESLYLLDTTLNLSFAIYYVVLLDSVVGVKKSFCIQTYLQNVNIKCVNIYI